MSSLAELMAQAGWGAYVLLMVGMLGLALGILGQALSWLSKSRTMALVFTGLLGALFLLTMALGVGFYLMGMYRVESALIGVDPAMRAELYLVGTREAMLSLYFAAGAGIMPLLCAGGTGIRWLLLRGRPS